MWAAMVKGKWRLPVVAFSVFWSVGDSWKPLFTVGSGVVVELKFLIPMDSTLHLNDTSTRIPRNLFVRLPASGGQ